MYTKNFKLLQELSNQATKYPIFAKNAETQEIRRAAKNRNLTTSLLFLR